MKQPLSKARIVAAAMEIVDREGLDGLSMRGLAGELGAGTMSLYNHFPNKSALLDAMVEEMLGAAISDRLSGDPVQRLRRLCHGLRQGAASHPEVFRIIATRPPSSPTLLRTLEIELENLNEMSMDRPTTAKALRILFAYVFGYIRLETGGFFIALEHLRSLETPEGKEIDVRDFPEVAAHTSQLARWTPDVEFDQGLEALLAGIQHTPPVS